MNIHQLHTLSGLAIVLALLCKVLLHFYLDYLHERNLSINSILVMPVHYLSPYKGEVKPGYVKWKYLCNSFLVLAGMSLVMNIIYGVLIYTG